MMRSLLSALTMLLASCALAQEAPLEPEIFEVVILPPEMLGGVEGLSRRVRAPSEAPARGEALVEFVVDERGAVGEARTLACSVEHAWCSAVLRAIEGSRFSPGMARGRPRRWRFTLPVAFAPEDSDARSTMVRPSDRMAPVEIVGRYGSRMLIGGMEELQQRAILPPEAIVHGVAGRVLVEMMIGPDGIARHLSVWRGIERAGLSAAQQRAALKIERNALDAIAGTRFRPASETTSTPLIVSIDFDLP